LVSSILGLGCGELPDPFVWGFPSTLEFLDGVGEFDEENFELKLAIQELLRPSFLFAELGLRPFLASSLLVPLPNGGRECVDPTIFSAAACRASPLSLDFSLGFCSGGIDSSS
jgi:hypothetical protein